MKKIAMGVAVIIGALIVPNATKGAFLNNEKVEVDVFNTPGVAVSDSDSSKSGVKAKSWLRIKFSFKSEEKKESFKYKSKDIYKWRDGVTVEAVAMVPSLYKGKPSTAAFKGSVKLASVKLDNKLHIGRLFIPPFYFDRYLRPGNSFPQKSSIKDFTIQLTFKDKSQQIIGMLYYYNGKSISYADKNGKNLAKSVQRKIGASSSETQMYDNAIVGPKDTPWAFSKFDSYEYIKPEEK